MDLEKGYDRVLREELCNFMRRSRTAVCMSGHPGACGPPSTSCLKVDIDFVAVLILLKPFLPSPPLSPRLCSRRLVSVARSRTFRDHQGKILLEGRRLICDALDAGAKPQTVFFSTVDRLRELPLDKLRRATLVKVKFEDIKLWSDVVAPQGVIGKGQIFFFGS